MNTMIVSSRNALFAAPTQPGKLLDGVELKDNQVPPYLQVLQNRDLNNPGFIGYFTYKFNKTWEMPTRVVLSGNGANSPDGFNLTAVPANAFSLMAFFWDPKEIKAGGKREFAYAYGGGIAGNPENDAHVAVVLGGSFEPGKLFTVSAYVDDPSPGQTLTLELPPGMERVEGKECQPVPPPGDEEPSVVLWKARVQRMGEFRIRVHSSGGGILTKIVSISQAK
jgi:hypothetical protein